MLNTIKTMLRALRGPSLEDREMAYLNASTDRYDLEYRQRQVDRGLFRKQDHSLMTLPGMR